MTASAAARTSAAVGCAASDIVQTLSVPGPCPHNRCDAGIRICRRVCAPRGLPQGGHTPADGPCRVRTLGVGPTDACSATAAVGCGCAAGSSASSARRGERQGGGKRSGPRRAGPAPSVLPVSLATPAVRRAPCGRSAAPPEQRPGTGRHRASRSIARARSARGAGRRAAAGRRRCWLGRLRLGRGLVARGLLAPGYPAPVGLAGVGCGVPGVARLPASTGLHGLPGPAGVLRVARLVRACPGSPTDPLEQSLPMAGLPSPPHVDTVAAGVDRHVDRNLDMVAGADARRSRCDRRPGPRAPARPWPPRGACRRRWHSCCRTPG